jgi:hypothetical protein
MKNLSKNSLKEQMEESVLSKHSLLDINGGACGPTATWVKTHENTDMNGDEIADDCQYEADTDKDDPVAVAISFRAGGLFW